MDLTMVEDRLKQFGEINVSEIMLAGKEIITVTPDEKVSTTELMMLKKKIGGLPVVSDKTHRNLVGIITQRDIRLARFAVSLDSPNTLIGNLMTPKPFVVKREDTIKHVLDLMFKHNIERLPVVNDKNELIGLVLQQRILKKLLNNLNQE